MLFCSQTFVFFFAALLVYWRTPWKAVRIWLLLAASFYVYAVWNACLALLIGARAVMDYLLALGMNHCTSPRAQAAAGHQSRRQSRRAVLFLAVAGS